MALVWSAEWPAGVQHLSTVPALQLTVEHVDEPMRTVLVRTSMPKFTPWTVVIVAPDAGVLNIKKALLTGASYVKISSTVPARALVRRCSTA
jgi:hypothetical protein